MIQPVRRDASFLEDVEAARARDAGFHVWWLGQSGFLLQWQGHHLLFDPYLSDSLTRKYAATEKPHVRMTERVVAPERLAFVDVVTSTHNHTDHLDAETLAPLLRDDGTALVVPEANRAFAAERVGVDPRRLIGLDAGTSATVGVFRLTGVPAAHETLETDDHGRFTHLGYVVEFGPYTVYHSGDTVRYEGMAERLRAWSIDLALLPINGRNPARRVPGNLDGPEAARLALDIGARHVIPCHFEMFTFNTASPDAFVDEAQRLGQSYTVLRAGERWSGE